MARPDWVNVTSGEVDLDSPGIEDVFTALKDNPAAMRVLSLFEDHADESHSNTTWTNAAQSMYLDIPDLADYTGIQRKLTVTLEPYVSSNSGEYRLTDVSTGTNGTAVTGVVNSSYDGTEITLELDIDSTWKGTNRQFKISSQIFTSGEVHYRIDKRHDVVLEY